VQRIYQLKVALNRAKPPIWRRFLVDPSVMTLATLHEVVQIVMGWQDVHAHLFVADGCAYGVPDPGWDIDEIEDEATVRLDQVLTRPKDTLTYEYDFGDGWVHTITLEKVLPFDPAEPLPRCVTGKRACPPEDVGGLWGYERFLSALSDPNHAEHEEFRSWVDDEFDAAHFPIDVVNATLETVFQPG
jgi:hypothetical protein